MPPRRSVSRLALAFVLVGVGAMALFVWRPIQRAWALAELQNSIHGVVKTDPPGCPKSWTTGRMT
jgi:hypothetical protein